MSKPRWQLKKYRGKWCAVAFIRGKTVRRSSGSESLDVAKQWFTDFVRIQSAPNETVGEIFEVYKQEKSDNEQTKLGHMWKALEPHFNNLRPDQLSREVAKRYAEHRSGLGISDNSIIRELGSVRSAAKWYDQKYPSTWYMPSKPDPKDRYLTREEYNALLESAVTPHIELFIRLALATAGRTSAILELKWDQIDFRKGMIDLGRGNRIKRRSVLPLNDTILEHLKIHYNARTCDYVIEHGGKPVKSISRGFAATVRRAGLKKVTPHVIRHTSAVWLAEAGESMSVIAQYLGHSSTAVTERTYARYSPDYLRRPSDVLQ